MSDGTVWPSGGGAGYSVDRRRFLRVGAAGLLATLSPRLAEASSVDRPNVLWLVSEDTSPYVGAYGDPVAATPTLDRLAAEGVRYRNAFSTSPVCAPSRFAIITGVHAESAGPAQHMRASGNIPAWLRGFPAYLRDAGVYCTNNAKTDYNAPIDMSAWDESSSSAHWRNRPDGAPFFAVFNFETTHEINTFAPVPGATRPEDVRMPAYSPDTPTTRRDRAHYYDLMSVMDGQVAQRLQELEDAGLAEDTIVFYYGDHGGALLRSKRFCFDSGLRIPLIVRFPRKWTHLAPAAAGSAVNAPVSLIDLAPTMLALYGLPVPDYMQSVPFAGNEATARRHAFSGRNRMDERYDMQRTVRDERFRYIRNYMPHLIYGQHLWFMWGQPGYRDWEQLHIDGQLDEVTGRFWRTKPTEELYDLDTDPDEVHNLAGDPHYAGVLNRMRTALDRHMLAVNDNGFIPEGSQLEGHDASRQGDYPLEDVMRLAGMAIERSPDNLRYLVDSLRHDNEVMRYWAALGCVMLGANALPAAAALTDRLHNDPSVHVRIVAAEALARLDDTGESVPALAQTLHSHPDVPVKLQALNALTNIGERAKPALPQITEAAASTNEYVGSAGRYLVRVLTGTYVPSP